MRSIGGEVSKQERQTYDYSSDSFFYTIVRNWPHFVLVILFMLGFILFMAWRVPILVKGGLG